MKKVILIPDSFKGTMSSKEICSIMKREILSFYPKAQVVSVPVADGGEGSVDAFLSAVGGKKVNITVKGPYFEDIESFYGILPDNTAVIEMAAAAGLPLVGEDKHPEKATTYGVGQLIKHALDSGCKKLIVGLGGSVTNDGGVGAAAALGAEFYDKSGRTFVPTGETLDRIEHINISPMLSHLSGAEIITMCDIDNPLCGENGAAYVFAPQKGADSSMVKLLDKNLLHLAEVIERDLKKDVLTLPGAGAAGGMGAGMAAFFASKLQMGIETVLDTVGFDSLISDADLVLTGEGKLDTQSLRGKVVIGVARRTKRQGVPLIAVVGDIDDDIEKVYDEGVAAVFSINRLALPYSDAKKRAQKDMALTVNNLMRCFKNLNIFKNI